MDLFHQMVQLRMLLDLMVLMDHQFLLFPHNLLSHHHPYLLY